MLARIQKRDITLIGYPGISVGGKILVTEFRVLDADLHVLVDILHGRTSGSDVFEALDDIAAAMYTQEERGRMSGDDYERLHNLWLGQALQQLAERRFMMALGIGRN